MKTNFNFRFDTERCERAVKLFKKSLDKIPKDAQEKLKKKSIAIMTGCDDCRANGFTFKLEELKEDNFLYLEPYIWDFEEEKMTEIIHHELAHIVLEHKIVDISEKEREKQEQQAKRLVKEWKNGR